MATSKTSRKNEDEGNEPQNRLNEGQKVIDWRFKQLILAGWGETEANLISVRYQGPEAIDLHEAVELVTGSEDRKACPPALAAEILL